MTEKINYEVLGDMPVIPGSSTPDVPSPIATVLEELATAIDAAAVQDLSLGTVTDTTVAIDLSGGDSATIGAATLSAAGLMTATDKSLIEGTATKLGQGQVEANRRE